jgi:hypothetical protein
MSLEEPNCQFGSTSALRRSAGCGGTLPESESSAPSTRMRWLWRQGHSLSLRRKLVKHSLIIEARVSRARYHAIRLRPKSS